MVQAAIGDQIGTPARDLAVDDPAEIDPGLADEIAPKFHDQLGVTQARTESRDTLREIGGDRGQIERLLTREIGDAESAPDVEIGDGTRRLFRQPFGECEGLGVGLDDRLGAQVLRASEDVEAAEADR